MGEGRKFAPSRSTSDLAERGRRGAILLPRAAQPRLALRVRPQRRQWACSKALSLSSSPTSLPSTTAASTQPTGSQSVQELACVELLCNHQSLASPGIEPGVYGYGVHPLSRSAKRSRRTCVAEAWLAYPTNWLATGPRTCLRRTAPQPPAHTRPFC